MDKIEDADDDINNGKVLFIGSNKEKFNFNFLNLTTLNILIVTLSSEDNVKLSKLLSEGFKRPIYWNEYKVIPNKIVENAANNGERCII